MNLYTWGNRTLAQADTLDVRFQEIINKIELVMSTIEDLIEDPIFMDNIHGEQELSLDLTLELFEAIASQFDPEESDEDDGTYKLDDSYDAE